MPGTWLGISKNKKGDIKLGNLTNVVGVKQTDSSCQSSVKQGRGPIVCDWINSPELTIENHAKKLYETCSTYNYFNFVSVLIENSHNVTAYHVGNAPRTIGKISPGCIGLSNSPLDSPFKKVLNGTEKFREIVKESDELSRDDLIVSLRSLLKSKERFLPDEGLIERRKAQYANPERFSCINVEIEELSYGTRTHTIVLVDNDNKIHYFEETMSTLDPEGEWITTVLNL